MFHKSNTSESTRRRPFLTILNYLPIRAPQLQFAQHFYFHLSYFQLIVILLSIQMTIIAPAAKDVFGYYMNSFAKVLSLRSLFIDHFQSPFYIFMLIVTWTYLLILLACISLLALRAVAKIYIIYLSRSFLENLYQFHFKILVWIINMILLAPFSTKTDGQNLAFGLDSNHWSLQSINGFCLFINNFLGAAFAYFSIAPYKGQNQYSSYSSSSQFIIFATKAVLAPLIIFIEKDNQHLGTTLAVVGLVGSLLDMLSLVLSLPYFVARTMKAALAWNFLAILISVGNIVVTTLSEQISVGSVSGIICIEFLMIPLLIKLTSILFCQIMKHYITRSLGKISSQSQAFKKLLSFDVMFENSDMAAFQNKDPSEYEAYFMGDMIQHTLECTEKKCICQVLVKENKDSDVLDFRLLKDGLEKYKMKRTSEILNKTIDRVKFSDELKIIQACVLLGNQDVVLNGALAFLYSISDHTAGLSVRIKKHILLKIVQENLDKYYLTRHDGVLDLKSFADFYSSKVLFKDLLLSNTRNYIGFWSYYFQSNFRLINLFKKSEVLERESDRIEKLWNCYIAKFPQFYSFVGEEYCNYQVLVRNSPLYASKIAKKFAWKIKAFQVQSKNITDFTKNDLFQPNSILLSISMAKERLGHILSVSHNTSKLGYSPEELIGKNINVLISPSLAQDHDKILQTHLGLHKSKIHNQKNYHKVNGFTKAKKGYYNPSLVYISISPYVEKELTYLGVLKINQPDYEQIIISEEGVVDGFTEKVGQQLELAYGRQIHITELCPDLPSALQKKGSKVSSILLDIINNDPGSPTKNKISFGSLLSKKTFTQEEQQEEIHWNALSFMKQGNNPTALGGSIRRKKELLTYEVKVVARMIMKRKFFVLQLQLALHEAFPSGTDHQTLLSPKFLKESIPTDFEIDEKIPGERDEGTGVTRESIMQTDAEFGLLTGDRNSKMLGTLQNNQNILSGRFETASEALMLTPKSEFQQIDLRNGVPKLSLYRKERKQKTEIRKEVLPRKETNNEESNSELGKKIRRHIQESEKAASSTSSGAKSKLEQAIFSVPKNHLSKYICFLVFVLLLLSIILLVLFMKKGENTMQLLEGNVEILNASSLRQIQLLFLQRDIQVAYMIKNGYILDQRVPIVGFPPLSFLIPMLIGGDSAALNNWNNGLRVSLNRVETSLQADVFNDLIPLHVEGGITAEMNTFMAATEIATKGILIASVPYSFAPDEKIDDFMDFIMRNGFNELLTSSEGINTIILTDTAVKFNYLENYALTFFLIVLGLGFLLLLLLANRQQKLTSSRNKFIEQLLRIDQTELQANIKILTLFETSMVKSISFNQAQKDEVTVIPRKEARGERAKQARLSRRDADFKHLNMNQVIIFVLGILIFAALFMPFAHSFGLVRTKSEAIEGSIGKIIKVSDSLYEMILMLVSFYDYIINHGQTTLRMKPINEEWEAIYAKRSRAQDFFLDFIIESENEGSCSPEAIATFKELITGNICEAVPPQAMQETCPIIAEGLLTKGGIQAINSYTLLTLRDIKDQYDLSQKTFQDAVDALDSMSLVNIETFVALWQYAAFIKLEQTLQACISEEIDRIQSAIITLVTLYIVFYVAVIPTLLRYLIRRIESERIGWRKVFRKIPMEVVMNSKLLKSFLERDNDVGYKM